MMAPIEGTGEAELMATIVEGAFEEPLWATFLQRLREVTRADYAILSFRPPGRPFAEAITLFSDAARSDLNEITRDGLPPGEPPVDETLAEGRPYLIDELLGPHATPQSHAYRAYLAGQGITIIRHMRVQEASGVHAWLTIARRGDEDFKPRDGALMKAIARVLRGALRQYVALERERFKASLIAEPVRRLEFGWITLDGAGQVLDHDPRGAAVLAESGVLGVTKAGRLTAHKKPLEREIFDALAKVAGNPQERPHAITLSHDPWLDMLLVPARRQSISASATPAAIAYVHGDSWRSADRHEHLAQLFRLSPQEARLALALCRGMTIAEAALEFGLSVGTARNYSKAVFAKTGARGQPDLVRIVMRSVLAIAPQT
ncbi:MAG TPA: helix-turn-helix transcriptional regulator [Sphingobium sp.]|uniref:helix-turn-helix transcriptional regulator n=1 Tax=Sphingobium sp. TaxID=1912891 RepID=UPI002ECFF76A